MLTADELVRSGAVLCPFCHGPLKVHGSYLRRCLDESGGIHNGWVAQMHCVACGVYPALTPEFISPHKHYMAGVIEEVLTASEEGKGIEGLGGFAADVSTMRRWVRQFRERGPESVGWLLSVLLTVYGRHIGSLELQGRALLKQLALLLRQYPGPGSGGVIGKANVILTTQNCGFL